MGLNDVVTRAVYSLIVSVIVMLAIPISQLQLVAELVECCCPDQRNCKCPDHDTDVPTQATMKACHKTTTIIASAAAPAFPVPPDSLLVAPAEHVTHVAFTMSNPHEPPDTDRPRGPS